MRMDAGLDTGPMLLSEAVPITPTTTASDLHDILADIGARLILRALAENPPPCPQPEAGATYAPKLTREDGRIEWTRDACFIEPPGSGPKSLARHLHHTGRRAAQGSRGRASRSLRPPRHGARRPFHGCMRSGSRPAPAGAAPRPRGHGCGGVPSRASRAARNTAWLNAAPVMRLWALRLEYDGGPFVGWQRQSAGVSVQAVLEDAASRLNGGRPVASVVAGRTDAGVHAEAQVAQLSLPERFPAETNSRCTELPLEAASRGGVGSGSRPRGMERPLLGGRACLSLSHSQSPRPSRPAKWPRLARASAARSGAYAGGGRDAASDGTTSPLSVPRPVRRAALCARWTGSTSHGTASMIEILAEARSFLHHQVRNMVGTLKLVGERRWRPDRVATALQRRDRSAAGPTAPRGRPLPDRSAIPDRPVHLSIRERRLPLPQLVAIFARVNRLARVET